MERWRINLYTLWVTQVFSLMGFGFCIPFIPFYFQEMGVTDPTELNHFVGLAFAVPAATMAVAAPIWGIVSDRYGRKVMLLRAMIAAAVLLVLMGVVTSVWQFMVLRALQGVFTGTVTASMGFVSANTPEHKMSYALGLMTSSNFIGYSIGPFFGGILAETVGYRSCFILGGVLMTIGFFLVAVLLKEDRNTYGYRIKIGQEEEAPKAKLFTPFIVAVLLTLLLQRIARSVFMPFVALYVQEQLGTVVGAATYTGFINGATGLATAIAALTITRLGDQTDKVRLALLLTAISLPVTLLMIPSPTLFLFACGFTVFFFLAGAAEPILTSAASEQTPASMRGALFGVWGTVGSIGAMISPLIGSTVSVGYGLKAILLVIPIFTGLQLLFLFRAKSKSKDGAFAPKGEFVMEDLHLHTYYSDGSLSPEELVRRAAELGMRRIAITDHDGLDGIADAVKEGEIHGIEVIPGIELSADLENESGFQGSVHILGHGIDVESEPLIRAVTGIKEKRKIRNEFLLEVLRRLGYPLSREDLDQRPGQDYIGKPNFAKALFKRGYINTPKEAFAPEQFLRHPEARKVKREKITAREAIRLIVDAGGEAVLAHPRKIGFLKPEAEGFEQRLETLLLYLRDLGLSGLECRYSTHTEEQADRLEAIASRLGLTVTAGSDFHGPDMDATLDIGITRLPPSRSSR
jgi:DHA1 family multidrug resistance protein-like MFS transporter